jgi:type I restriction enzyme R subunit
LTEPSRNPRGSLPASANFAFLKPYGEGLVILGAQAERYFTEDPVTALIKLRQLAERLAQEAAARIGLFASTEENQVDLLRRLIDRGVTTREVHELFHGIRKAGNAAVHQNEGSHQEALHQLKAVRALAVWFHRSFGQDRAFKAGPFVPPQPPIDASAALERELADLRASLAAAEGAQAAAQRAAEDARAARASAEERARVQEAEREALEALVDEAARREAEMVGRLVVLQAQAAQAPAAEIEATVEQAIEAAATLDLDEVATRKIIDEQLRAAGWEADTSTLRWSDGVRPQRGRNLAIAEWPTENGPADYALFVGLTPVGVVEAKRRNVDVAGKLSQSKRYSIGFKMAEGATPAGPWGDHRVPFLFSTNGRPYFAQIKEKSGIWFIDVRRPQNLAVPLIGWYTPAGLAGLLKQNVDAAEEKLRREPTEYLGLRDYQIRAIKAAEEALEKGQRTALLAMATGTGKTRTCIGLCYRLLKTQRFRRVLFLVDRTALGEQAMNALKDSHLEGQKTFHETYDLKGLADINPDPDTKLHVATIQGLVKRILYSEDSAPPVDQYDCIVVDECHRGYLLDREMSDGELAFRSEADYVSKYRRVLEYFDAVKIGLTATPAIHTVDIFGKPVFQYTYREAVVDGWLIDHEPPVRIVTALAEDGITWLVGEKIEIYQPSTHSIQLSLLSDEVHVEIEEFNKRVVTESFNRVVCGELAKQIDPSLPGKTIVYCATDQHADMVVRLLKEAFRDAYGEVEDDAVVKITGAADRPLELIRRLKNERLPSVAVTVDLLTTGVDVPAVTNLVFLRRVRSRILYEQMLGRATRLCEEIKKSVFRIFDAVDLYATLAPYTGMKPVVANPAIPFGELVQELRTLQDPAHRREAFDQLLAKLERKRRHLDGEALLRFEAVAGQTPQDLIRFLRENGPEVARQWFAEHVLLADILDGTSKAGQMPLIISHHADEVRSVEHGYGDGRQRPDDYLSGFAKFLKDNLNLIPALLVVTQRPRDLTRQQLKELRLALDNAGYPEATVRAAWRDKTNQDIAASIIGFVRQAALGDPLVPYGERVERALAEILASRYWTQPQKQWLERVGKQLREEVVVDHEALGRGQFAAQGGFARLDRIFEGRLDAILGDINERIWKVGA